MTEAEKLGERRFLLVKRGLYYRPESSGYTGIKDNAGRYLESDARPDSGVTAVHEDDAPKFSESCFPGIAFKHLNDEVARLTAELAAKDEALRFYAEEWEQDVDAEQTAQGWTGSIGEVRPTEALCNDFGQRARAALNERNSHE